MGQYVAADAVGVVDFAAVVQLLQQFHCCFRSVKFKPLYYSCHIYLCYIFFIVNIGDLEIFGCCCACSGLLFWRSCCVGYLEIFGCYCAYSGLISPHSCFSLFYIIVVR